MRESVCAFQEGIYGSEVSLFEMASHNLSSVFAKFLSLCLGCLGRPGPARRARIHSGSAPKLLVDRKETFQLFVPILDDGQLRRRQVQLAQLDHQETLTVRCHVKGERTAGLKRGGHPKEQSGLSRSEGGLGLDVHSHQVVTANVKQLPVLSPERASATFCREGPLPSRAWKGLDIDLRPARFIGFIRQPMAIRCKP